MAESRALIYDFISAAPAKLGTDPERVLLLGFSQGATMTWNCMLSGPWPAATADQNGLAR
jgi:phospholipase/carboxylesterase